MKLAQEKAVLLAKSAGVKLGTLQSVVDRAQSMTINADAYEERHMLALQAAPEPHAGLRVELCDPKNKRL